MVGLISCRTHLVLLSILLWTDVNSDLNSTSDLNLAFLVLGSDWYPELVLILLVELELLVSINPGENIIEVLLVEYKWLLGKTDIVKDVLEVNLSFSNDIVGLEEITVIHLKSQLVVLGWVLVLVE